ncbi:MAG: helix-turn-helix domain-containing protein [Verrucomicrobiales bacterium]|jgi:transcriptional regulator with XRE-family HTH domain|nr:helix-turn-helix domain-containing protein [Verrucomicrobiales bacterium]
MRKNPFEFGKSFAAVVEKHRKKMRLSRTRLAELAGLHQTYIGLMESGQRSPNLGTAKAIADGLKIPLHKLIRETEGASDAR